MKKQLPLAIIGSGGATVQALEAIRHSGYEGEIHLFTDQSEPPYNPMLLTYYLAGKIPLDQCFITGNNFNFIKKCKAHIHLSSPVVELNVREKTISNTRGERIRYQACLVSSGASPIKPSFFQSEFKSDRVFTFRTLDDAIKLREILLQGPKKMLIVGASMIGIKLVEIFQEADSEVYFADMASHVFPLSAHPDCAVLIENLLNQNHVNLLLSQKINFIEESKNKVRVSLTTSEIEVDYVILCVGVKPNLDFLRPSDLLIDKGILVNEKMQASVDGVFAAGDVAQATNLLTQRQELIPLWSNACHQGRVAGSNMSGAEAVFPGSIPQNLTHFFNRFFVSIGDIRLYDKVIKQMDHDSTLLSFKSKGETIGFNLLSIESTEKVNAVGVLRYEVIKNIQGGIR
jgi:NADPH-dependent 2,4-dienoyl-CoA reductase/sulfur reductase-like enzyme